MCKLTIVKLIQFYAVQLGVEPNLAVAVAEYESSMNILAIGTVGEVGLFQIRPNFSVFNSLELQDPIVNIIKGLKMLKYSQKHCIHQNEYGWLTCYNRGITGAKNVLKPNEDSYVIKVLEKLNNKTNYTCDSIQTVDKTFLVHQLNNFEQIYKTRKINMFLTPRVQSKGSVY